MIVLRYLEILDPWTYPVLSCLSVRPSIPLPLPLESNLFLWEPVYLLGSVSLSKIESPAGAEAWKVISLHSALHKEQLPSWKATSFFQQRSQLILWMN